MNPSIDDLLDNPFWHALMTEHAALALGSGPVRRYPAEVVPFAGLAESRADVMEALRELLAPGESIFVMGEALVESPGLAQLSELSGWQMLCETPEIADVQPIEGRSARVERLTAEHAPAMVALTDVAFPGYFRRETYRMGSYYGIYVDGELVAMAGERLAVPGFREISAVCTHPAHTGHGYAAQLMTHVMRTHVAKGLRTFLHVAAANQRAIDLYQRLGFVKRRSVLFHHLQRSPG
jgi:GNAT superfamily N-acetyltransferase